MTIKIIGGVEPVLIKGLANRMLARVDTGAKTSSIHSNEFYIQNGILCFYVQDGDERKFFVADDWIKVKVRSSNGIEERFMFRLSIQFAGKSYLTKFTLSDRSEMKYKVLLGRTLLNHRFVVDPSQKSPL